LFLNAAEIMLQNIHAEREGLWSLHLQSVCDMLPYFFITNRTNYSRWTDSSVKLDLHFTSMNHTSCGIVSICPFSSHHLKKAQNHRELNASYARVKPLIARLNCFPESIWSQSHKTWGSCWWNVNLVLQRNQNLTNLRWWS
jgi:hypothetical protein